MRLYRALCAFIETLTMEAQARADLEHIEAMEYQFDMDGGDEYDGYI